MKKKFLYRLSLVLYFCVVGTVFSYGAKYEAENAAYGGGNWVDNSDAGFSGTGYLRNFNDVGSYVEFSITGATAGAQDVLFHYTTGGAGSLNLYVNGTYVKKVTIPTTGGWSNWQDYAINVTLNAGNNTIKFIHEASNTGNFFYYLDYLSVDLNAIAVTGVSVSPSTLSMPDLTTSQLSATVTPEDASNKTVTWSSSNTAVATVSSSGLVSALTPGEATITATTNSGNLTSTCVVTVTPSGLVKYEAEDATRNDTYIVSDWPGYSGIGFINHFGAVGNSLQFTIAGANAGAQDITVSYATGTGIVLNLYVNDVLVGPANFANTGGWGNWTNHVDNVTLNAGTNTIKYQKDVSADSWLNFDYLTVAGSIAVSGVTVSPEVLSITDISSSQLTATVLPSGASNKTVTWSSSNENVATVSQTGLVTGVAVGNATITVTTVDGGKTATCAVTVTASNVILHGSIIKKSAPLSEQIDWTHGTTFPENATVDYKIVTIGGKLWAKIVGMGYNLHFQPWSSQIRLYPLASSEDNMWELTKYNAPNNVNYNTGNNTTIVTACSYPNPAFDHIRIVQSQMDAYSGTELTAYNVNAPSSGLTGDTQKPVLTTISVGTQSGTTIPVNCTASDNSGDYFYIVSDVANDFYYVSFTDDFTVTGLTEGVTYTLSVIAVDFSGNESTKLTTSQTSYDAVGGISLSQNPFSKGSLSIKLPEGATQLTIFDIAGKAVYQTQATKNEYLIDQSVFKSNGIYIVNAITTKGSKNQKLIVTK